MNYRLPYTLKNNSSALVHSKFWWPFKALLSCFQHPQKLTNECTHGAVMSQPSVGFSQSSTLNQSPCSCWCVYAVFQAFSFTSHQFLAGFPNRLSSVISTTFVVVFFKILLFKMQISNTCCSLTRTAHSWDIDTNNFRFSVDSMKQNFRFDYFFQFSHKKGSFFLQIYILNIFLSSPARMSSFSCWCKRSDEAHKCWRRVTAVCSLKCQHWLWGKLLKSTSIIMTWGNTLMNKISNCALSV